MLLALDVSMPGWFTKTCKLDGLPSHTHEPRKLGLLGTIIKNPAECESSAMV